MELSLAKLPWYAQIGAFVVLAIAGVGAFYYHYEMPAQEEMATRKLQLKGLMADISKGQATAKKLPEFEKQVGELEAKLSNLRAFLPEDKDAGVLVLRQDRAQVAQLRFELAHLLLEFRQLLGRRLTLADVGHQPFELELTRRHLFLRRHLVVVIKRADAGDGEHHERANLRVPREFCEAQFHV